MNTAALYHEVVFSTSRSSGPGGQNVNKVNTKVTLKFDVAGSAVLSDEEKQVIAEKLATRITTEGILVLVSQDKRSQLENKEAVKQKFAKLIAKAFEKKKARKATKPSKASVKERIETKKRHAEKKKWRRGADE
jgi:ribosome-associated protein